MKSDSLNAAAYIPLTKSRFAVIDLSDAQKVSKHKWCALTTNTKAYAQRRAPRAEGGGIILLHRFLMNPPDGLEVDHIDGDGLNNRRANLRIVRHCDNQKNQLLSSANTSGYKGVTFDKQTGKWRAQIKHNGRRQPLGRFAVKEDAARAYDMAARRLFGEFARLNFQDAA